MYYNKPKSSIVVNLWKIIIIFIIINTRFASVFYDLREAAEAHTVAI